MRQILERRGLGKGEQAQEVEYRKECTRKCSQGIGNYNFEVGVNVDGENKVIILERIGATNLGWHH